MQTCAELLGLHEARRAGGLGIAGEWEAPTQEIAEEARLAAEAIVPPPQEQDTFCDVSMWTGPMGWAVNC